ncbi:hypothetical protein BDV32DRAFT_120583 [Aspergillus pseudonomiae]|nr:hypothetical protein BDV32DRAFT_120583 [Aspergillus pseudonomiae]
MSTGNTSCAQPSDTPQPTDDAFWGFDPAISAVLQPKHAASERRVKHAVASHKCLIPDRPVIHAGSACNDVPKTPTHIDDKKQN